MATVEQEIRVQRMMAVAMGMGALMFVLVALLVPVAGDGQSDSPVGTLSLVAHVFFVMALGSSMLVYALYRAARGTATYAKQRTLSIMPLALAEGASMFGGVVVLLARLSGQIEAMPWVYLNLFPVLYLWFLVMLIIATPPLPPASAADSVD